MEPKLNQRVKNVTDDSKQNAPCVGHIKPSFFGMKYDIFLALPVKTKVP